MLPNSGHAVNLEEPGLFNAALADFWLRSMPAAGPLRDPRAISQSITGMTKVATMNDKKPRASSRAQPRRPGGARCQYRRHLAKAAPENEALGPPHAPGGGQAQRAAAVSAAAARRLRRRRSRSRHLVSHHGGDCQARCQHRLVRQDKLNGCAASSAALAPEVAHKMWGEDPRAALSWGPPIQSRAEEVDGGHRLGGEWGMSSGSRHATWLGLMAPVFDGAGKPVPLPQGVSARIFFVPAGAVEWIDNWDVIGLNATCSGGYRLRGPLRARRLFLQPGALARRAAHRGALQVSSE